MITLETTIRECVCFGGVALLLAIWAGFRYGKSYLKPLCRDLMARNEMLSDAISRQRRG